MHNQNEHPVFFYPFHPFAKRRIACTMRVRGNLNRKGKKQYLQLTSLFFQLFVTETEKKVRQLDNQSNKCSQTKTEKTEKKKLYKN